MISPISALAEAIQGKQPVVLATVVEVNGASPAKPGAQIVLLPDGRTAGTVGGGRLEASILEDAKQALLDGKPCLRHYHLAEEGQDAIGTLCGGEIRVFIQPYLPAPQLVIVGGGHIGRPLRVMGEAAGFDVEVVDVQPGLSTVPELEQVKLTCDSYVILITTDHISDEAALRVALKTEAPYIGMIGSLAKARTILGHLQSDGFSEDELSRRVYAPIGLDLGGNSPQEIAVGILAEVIACRQKKGIAEHNVKTRRLHWPENNN
jgi:xanthine dehydrogenase accessory factor